MNPSHKAKRGLCGTALQILEWQVSYRVLDWVQAPFAYVFWLIGQHKGWLQDLLANGGTDQ
jgi:hypothetical protein